MSDQELRVQARLENLFFKLYPVFKHFPKFERHSLTERIKESFYDAIRYLSAGSAVKSKRFGYYQEVDGNIRNLKFLLKVAHRQKYITPNFYEELDIETTEISRIVSALIRSCK